MTKEHSPDRLDVKAFAQAGAHLSGHDTLLRYQRLAEEARGLHPDLEMLLARAGIPPTARAEEIDLERFCALARALAAARGGS